MPDGMDKQGPSVTAVGRDMDAAQRTRLAGDRTSLANERTLAAWWRTAMTALAAAIGLTEFFGDVEPAWLIRCGGTIFVLFAYAILITAYDRYEDTARSIEAEDVVCISRWSLRLGTILLALVGTVTLFAIWA